MSSETKHDVDPYLQDTYRQETASVGLWCRTAKWLTPDSNHTSKISVSFLNDVPFANGATKTAWQQIMLTVSISQYSIFARATLHRQPFSIKPVCNVGVITVVHSNAGIGTPHIR